MYLITCTLVVIAALFILDWFLNGRQRAKLFWKIRGPPGAFIFGNCLQVVGTPEQVFCNLRTWANSYKDIYRQWIYPYGVIHIYNPNDVETIISNSKYNEKSLIYDFIRPWLRDGLLLSKGEKWKMRRKILTPSFHFGILKKFIQVIEENNWKMIADLEIEANAPTDVIKLMSNVTLNSICETSMGIKLEDASTSGVQYKKAIYEIGKLIIYRIARSWLAFDPIFNLTDAGKRQKEVLEIIHTFPKRIIKERREYTKENGFDFSSIESLEEDLVFKDKKKMAMLDLLLFAEKEGMINEDGIEEEVATFIFEGHDTTAMSLSYALIELANNANIQKKVFQEIYDIFGESKRRAVMHDLNQMKYLECCIKETLRLYPPVPFISRYITDSIRLSGNEIPAGKTLCHIHIFDLHRRADLYSDPLVFDPERFFPENCSSRHPYAFVPFSGGPRNCIGQRFGIMELKSVLSTILRNFELHPVTVPTELTFAADLVLRPTKPIYVKFIKRVS